MGEVIAVTGATGLVGAAVVERLRALGHGVLTVGRRPANDRHCDLHDPASVAHLDLEGVGVLIHCANVVDEDFATNAAAAYAHATTGIEALMQRVRAAKIRRVVSLSTAHVYGPLVGSIDESSSVDPRSDYAIAHYSTEQIVKRHALSGEFEAAILRPCNIYGNPADPDGFDRWHLIPFDFPRRAARGLDIVLHSSGRQMRNLVSLADITDMIVDLLSRRLRDGWLVGNPVGPDTMGVFEFASLCAAVAGELLGSTPAVVRPSVKATKDDATFTYTTVYPFLRGRCDISDFLNEVIPALAS